MKTASMARQQTKWLNQRRSSSNAYLEDIEREINEKINQGEFNLKYKIDSEDIKEVREKLIDLGYKVDIGNSYFNIFSLRVDSIMRISWE